MLANADSDAINELGKLGFGGIYVIKQNGDKAQREASNQLNSNIGASDGTQNVVSLDNGTYYRLTVQDTSSSISIEAGLIRPAQVCGVVHGCGAWASFL